MVLDSTGHDFGRLKDATAKALEAFKNIEMNPTSDMLLIEKLPAEVTKAGVVLPKHLPAAAAAQLIGSGAGQIYVGRILKAGNGRYDLGTWIENPFKVGDVVICNSVHEITWCGESFFQTSVGACLGKLPIDDETFNQLKASVA